MIAYNKAMAELEKKKNEDGYMTKPYPQLLTFKSEPNAGGRRCDAGPSGE